MIEISFENLNKVYNEDTTETLYEYIRRIEKSLNLAPANLTTMNGDVLKYYVSRLQTNSNTLQENQEVSSSKDVRFFERRL